MTNEVSPLSTIQENIKDKIKAEFVNLIPDDMWEKMVSSVVTDFTSDDRKDQYGRSVTGGRSPLKDIIYGEVEKLSRAAIKAELEKLSQASWNQFGEQVVGEAMQKLVADNFQTILASVQSGMVQQAVFQAVNQMRQSMMR